MNQEKNEYKQALESSEKAFNKIVKDPSSEIVLKEAIKVFAQEVGKTSPEVFTVALTNLKDKLSELPELSQNTGDERELKANIRVLIAVTVNDEPSFNGDKLRNPLIKVITDFDKIIKYNVNKTKESPFKMK